MWRLTLPFRILWGLIFYIALLTKGHKLARHFAFHSHFEYLTFHSISENKNAPNLLWVMTHKATCERCGYFYFNRKYLLREEYSYKQAVKHAKDYQGVKS
jgi:hypothetical protein